MNIIPNSEGKQQIDLEVLVNEEDNSIYVKFTGFEDITDADKYAEYLADHLPLLLFESEMRH